MSKFTGLCIAMLAILPLIHTKNYCDVNCAWFDYPHTMCQYPTEEPSGNCGAVDVIGLTPDEEYELLILHNNHRAYVASGSETRGLHGGQPGGYIPELQWDPELAEIAQRWASQCDTYHDKCRDVDRFIVNQNIAWTKWSDQYHGTLAELVQGWYDEVDDFNGNFVKSYQSSMTAVTTHYSQLVWAETTHVGCGFIKYREDGGWFTTLLVCNYGPMGNMIGQQMY